MTERSERGRLEDLGRTLDREIQNLIDFVNDRVVPAARQDTEVLLRKAATKLEQLADRLAAEHGGATPPSTPPTPPKDDEPGKPA